MYKRQIIPLLQVEDTFSNPATKYVIIAVVIMLVGVALTAKAGIERDKLIGDTNDPSNMSKGIMIAVSCGVLSALLNVGFANATPVALEAEKMGALIRNSSLAAWVVVLMGAFLMNLGYALLLLFKNNSWDSFNVPAAGNAYKWAILAGLFWFAALGIYGQGSALMGTMGPIIGWPMLLGLSLIISNIWALRSGEWKDAKKPFQLMLVGLGIIIFASVLLGYSNTVS